MAAKDTEAAPQSGGQTREWNYHPDLPIAMTPLFDWPPRPGAVLRWFASYWLTFSTTVVLIALTTAVYVWTLPPMAAMASLSAGWVAQIWGRNLALVVLMAGGLHIALYIYRTQGKRLKFEHREQAKNNGTFTFRNQLYDNMFWTLASGVTLWTAFECGIYWAMANGWAPRVTWARNPVWFALWFLIIPIWSSLHFYWIHRFLHWPPIYKIAHALHHRNVNVGPWSGISMHPLEHLLFYTNFLIHLVVPSHPAHVIFHAFIQSLGPIASHSGFEGLIVKDERRMKLGDFFHQLHHRYFECNYGTVEMPWDRWFGTFHNGTAEATADVRERRRRLFGG